MASEQERRDPQKRAELEEKAKLGETVVPGGTGGFSVEAQEHLAEGTHKHMNVEYTIIDTYTYPATSPCTC